MAALLVTCLAVPAIAQQTGSIRGRLADETGGTVVGAKITVINEQTGLTRETVSNSVGRFSVGDLPVGNYTVSVEKDGFSTAVVTDIPLNVADVREVNLTLEVGAITDEITTVASAVLVQTVGGEVSGLIDGEQIRELPLNGRNFLQLTLLMPGVSAPDGFNTKNKGLLTGSDLSVSGGMTTGNMWTVDGANNNDVGSNRTILVYPSLEAIEEFKIHRNSYGAEFGGGGGAQVNLVTRGGTNDFSGSVFFFQRNDSWNSTNAILEEADQPKAPLDREDYGYTFGGPIKRDRVHFFLSQEWNDELRGVPRSSQVPTALEKQGNFSQSDPGCPGIPIDPLTGQPFPGNIIPADRISEAGRNFVEIYPDANTSIPGTCTNWVTSIVTPIDWEQINGRVDWNVTNKHRALVRYTEDDWVNPGPTAGDANGLWGDDPFPSIDSNWQQPSDSLVAQLNSIIGTTALNTLTYSESGNAINIVPGGLDPQLGGALQSTIPPFFSAANKTNLAAHPVFWGGGGLEAVWVQSPWNNAQDIELYKDDYEQVFGDHVLKAGVLYSENSKAEPLNGASDELGRLWGGFPGSATGYVGNAWAGNSGNTIADFLLEGSFFGFSEISRTVPGNIKWEDLEVYVSDSWKARPNLTLDYGIRYSLYQEPYNANPNEFLSFNPDRFDPALGGAPCNGLMQVPGTDPCGEAGFAGASTGPNKALINEDDDNFAPRLGVAWDITGNATNVLRAGFGQFFQRDRVSPHLGLPGNPPLVQTASGLRTLDGQFSSISTSPGRPQAGWDIDRQTPYMLQTNIAYERAFGRSSSIEIAYVGSRGKHILQSQQLNYVPEGDNNGNGINDRLEYVQCPQGDAACQASFQKFGAFGTGGLTYWTTNGKSEYDSIQTQYITRFGRGSQLQASYTFSDFKSQGDVAGSSGGLNATETVTDIDNPELDFGPAETDREHIFNASVIHNLPTFEGQGGFKEWFLGNWSVGGIVNYTSGTPITVFTGGFSGLSVAGGGTGYNEAQRPIRVDGVSCSGSGGRQVLNPNAFTLDGYRLGDTSQQASRGACEGPDFFQVDLSLYKGLRIGSRVNLQLRIEIFNVFDETNWFDVENNWDGVVTYDDALTTVVSSSAQSNFGLARRARDAREMQLGLKVSF
ncbi:MAG TPA: carboxypeptidase-like regulatory domain-containing protein [Thermoanaerobaculia bacterium]|nr:carboxypeptidase-like regulatory domain-containing protein [Thermoanaerobaculia bacterium]